MDSPTPFDDVCMSLSTVIIKGRAQPQIISGFIGVKIMWNLEKTQTDNQRRKTDKKKQIRGKSKKNQEREQY